MIPLSRAIIICNERIFKVKNSLYYAVLDLQLITDWIFILCKSPLLKIRLKSEDFRSKSPLI